MLSFYIYYIFRITQNRHLFELLECEYRHNDEQYYYAKNLQKDIIGILDSDGNCVVEYVYNPWGDITSITGSMKDTLGNLNPFRYRSYYYDNETGFYYLQSRYYDPTVCRFINADDLSYLGEDGNSLSYNLFAYCGNNPVKNYDPSGHSIVTKLVNFALSSLVFFIITESKMVNIGWKQSTMKFADLIKALLKYRITNKQSIRHFIAQTSHESACGQYTKELASGEDYENRKDRGNTKKGDGKKYKGAGFIQLTGRANYQNFANSINDKKVMDGVDYVAKNYPWSSAAYWWKSNGMNELCAKGVSVKTVTKKVNGGTNGLAEREKYYEKCKKYIK